MQNRQNSILWILKTPIARRFIQIILHEQFNISSHKLNILRGDLYKFCKFRRSLRKLAELGEKYYHFRWRCYTFPIFWVMCFCVISPKEIPTDRQKKNLNFCDILFLNISDFHGKYLNNKIDTQKNCMNLFFSRWIVWFLPPRANSYRILSG